MVRDAVVFYRSFADAIRGLPAEEFKACALAIIDYGLDGTIPEGNGIEKVVFSLAKAQIDANNRKYLNGKSGGRPLSDKTKSNQTEQNQNQTKPNRNQTEPKEKDKEKEKEKDKEKEKEKEKEKGNEKEKKTFIPPAPEDVSTYCQEKGYDIDPEAFVDFYESKGWMIGKNKMIDWKAAVRTWARSQRPQRQEKTAEPNVFDEWRNA